MPEKAILAITIFLMMVVTYSVRAIPLQISFNKLPNLVKMALEYLPVAIIASVTVPPLVLNGDNIDVFNASSLAAIPVALVAYISRNLILSVVTGVIVFLLIHNFS